MTRRGHWGNLGLLLTSRLREWLKATVEIQGCGNEARS
jgi:hypothetical protein